MHSQFNSTQFRIVIAAGIPQEDPSEPTPRRSMRLKVLPTLVKRQSVIAVGRQQLKFAATQLQTFYIILSMEGGVGFPSVSLPVWQNFRFGRPRSVTELFILFWHLKRF